MTVNLMGLPHFLSLRAKRSGAKQSQVYFKWSCFILRNDSEFDVIASLRLPADRQEWIPDLVENDKTLK